MESIKSINQEQIDFIDSEFTNLGYIGLGKFADCQKKVLLFNSAPFIDEDIYPFFFELITLNEIRIVNFFGLPIEKGRVYLEISESLPYDYGSFLRIMEDTYLHYTGGIGYDESKRVLFSSSGDTEILEIQLNDDVIIPNTDMVAEYILSTEKANELIRDHLDFLSPND